MYHLSFSKRAKKEFDKLEGFVKIRVAKQLRKLSNGEKLDIKKVKGTISDYRLRIGNYRIIFQLEDKDIVVTKIGLRKNIYK